MTLGPPSSFRWWAFRALLAAGALVLVVGALIVAMIATTNDLTGARRDDDIRLLVQRFGAPDSDDSTADDSPRPPIVTRILTFDSERVRAIYRADAKFGAPLPSDVAWKLIGFTDPRANRALDSDQAVSRLERRTRK